MKRDLESIFKRLKTIKQKLNKQMPEACEAVMGAGTEAREEDDEYDEAIRRRRMEQELELHEAANKTNESPTMRHCDNEIKDRH